MLTLQYDYLAATFSLDAHLFRNCETFPNFGIELVSVRLVSELDRLQTRVTDIAILTIIIALLKPLLSIFQAFHPPQLLLVVCRYRVHLCGVVSLLLGTCRSLRTVEVLAQQLELITVHSFGQGI